MRKRIEKEFDVVCHVDNDVKCTVIAENEFGEGKRCRNMIYLNIGTGLAAGMIVNGLLVRGSDEWAGEVGFMNFTGGKGERVEMLASGMALMAQAKKMISEYENTENVYTLSEFAGEGEEIPDPYGKPLTAYGECFEVLKRLIDQLEEKLNSFAKGEE